MFSGWAGFASKSDLNGFLTLPRDAHRLSFDVVGAANSDSAYARTLTKRAGTLTNVIMHGRVRHSEMVKYFRRGRVLCCTSAYEGFPNTFLEAWTVGTPVVSTFDPDSVITQHNLGWTASNVDELIVATSRVNGSVREMVRGLGVGPQLLPEESCA